jgi:hypothetical protein
MKRKRILAGTAAASLVLAASATWWAMQRDQRTHPTSPDQAAAAPLSRPSTTARIADSETLLAERLKAAKEISFDLSNEELKELHAFLVKPIDERNRETELMALNEVMNQLRVTGLACGEYASALCNLIRDPEAHPVVRDYAIQHAVQWIREAAEGRTSASISEEDRRRLLDCAVAFLQEPTSLHETGYGTALHTLRTLESVHPDETQEIFALCAPRISDVAAGHESAPLANRISAIQSLSALPDREAAIALVREFFAAAPPGSPLRLVLVAALGDNGDTSDLETLRRLEKDEPRLAYAARSAAERLESQLSVSR